MQRGDEKKAADEKSPGTRSRRASRRSAGSTVTRSRAARRGRSPACSASSARTAPPRRAACARCDRGSGGARSRSSARRRAARRAAGTTSPGRWRPAAGSRCPRSGAPSDAQRRQAPVARLDVGAHQAERLGDPVDRPAADRLVAVERPFAARLPASQPGSRRNRVPALPTSIAAAARCAAQPDAARSAASAPASPSTSAPTARDRGQVERGVGRVEVVADDGLALAHRADDRGAVGDRLVGRRRERPAQRPAGPEAGHAPPPTIAAAWPRLARRSRRPARPRPCPRPTPRSPRCACRAPG